MTRITLSQSNHNFRRATSFLGAAFLALALVTLAVPAAHADTFSPCDKVKFGASGQCYAFKDGC